MNEFVSRQVVKLVGLGALVLCAACGLEGPEGPEARGPGEVSQADTEDVGLIELALETVPPDVTCLRVTARGPYREKQVALPVVAGPPMAQSLAGFPLGKVEFVAEAFAETCGAVTARTVASWVSDPVEVSVVEGTKTRVSFTMRRNGRLDVSFEFGDEPLCSAVGIVCKSARECCSSSCKDGLCQAAEP